MVLGMTHTYSTTVAMFTLTETGLWQVSVNISICIRYRTVVTGKGTYDRKTAVFDSMP